MYAVLRIPGRQIKAEPGQVFKVDFLESKKEGDKVVFDQVMLLNDGKNVQIGSPYVKAAVHVTVVSHDRAKKVIVYKKKRRTDSHKKLGHRQRYTTVRVDSIEA
jgi:large subunit ribosomal protein L21